MSQPTDPTHPAPDPAAPPAGVPAPPAGVPAPAAPPPAPAAPVTAVPASATPAPPAAAQPDPVAAAAPAAAALAPGVTPAASPGGTAATPGAGAVPPLQPLPPGPPAPPPSGGKLKPPVIIGAIVGAVALVGGAFALFGGSRESSAAERPDTAVTVPPGMDVLDPSVGPQVDDPITPTTVPGLDLDEVVVTTTTTTEPPTPTTVPAGPQAGAVPVGAGTSVTPAPGWAVRAQDPGFVGLYREAGGAEAYASLFDSGIGSVADEVMVNYVSGMVAPYISELEVSAISSQTVSGNVTSAATLAYRGLVTTQSGGATPVEGFVLVMIRQDGTVAVWEELNAAGQYEAVSDDLTSMLNTFIRSL